MNKISIITTQQTVILNGTALKKVLKLFLNLFDKEVHENL